MKQLSRKHLCVLLAAAAACLALPARALADEAPATDTVVRTSKLVSYAGGVLPDDWLVVSTINDRVVLGFTNNTAINVHLRELAPEHRQLVASIRDGTLNAGSQGSAGITREKLSQWSSQFTSTVSKLGKSLKDQFDSFISSHSTAATPAANSTKLTNETILIV